MKKREPLSKAKTRAREGEREASLRVPPAEFRVVVSRLRKKLFPRGYRA